MTMILKHFLDECKHTGLKSIEQRFFMSGHSYNSCDRCFATIEKQKKITENIFVPEHWYNVIYQSKKIEPKFKIVKMQREDFYSSKQLEDLIVNRKKSIDGHKINWLQFQTIIHDQDDPFNLKIKEYTAVNTKITTISLQKKHISAFPKIDLKFLYDENRAISEEKYKDLNQLIQYIPDHYHEFYKSLRKQ